MRHRGHGRVAHARSLRPRDVRGSSRRLTRVRNGDARDPSWMTAIAALRIHLPRRFSYAPAHVKVLVLLNQAAGTLANSSTGDEAERIRAGFVAAGADVDVRNVEGADL